MAGLSKCDIAFLPSCPQDPVQRFEPVGRSLDVLVEPGQRIDPDLLASLRNGNLSPEVRLRTRAAARQASYSLFAPDVVWRTVKKSSDTDYYIQVSQDAGSNYTGVFNIDVSGRVGIFTGSANLTDQFYVSGGTIKFETANSGISFDPQNADISSTVTSDPLTFNYNSVNDVIIGTNVLYIENGTKHS